MPEWSGETETKETAMTGPEGFSPDDDDDPVDQAKEETNEEEHESD
jgi:hypothetical protein